MKKIFFIIFCLNIIFLTYVKSSPVDSPEGTDNFSKKQFYQIQIYADSIDYDAEENIVAKGNVKIIKKNEILTSSLVIINQNQSIIILPKEFEYKDERDNYYFGTSGEFSTDFVNGKINNIKMLLNDGLDTF